MTNIRITPNSKSGKLIQMVSDFSGGLNTRASVHEVNPNQIVEGTNFDIDERGSISKRRGWTSIVASLGAQVIQGLYMFKMFNYRELLAVHNGKFYRYVTNAYSLLGTGAWEEVIIRRPPPQGVKATDTGTGTVGANLVASTAYDFGVVAKDASGSTVLSSVSRVTLGATPHPVLVAWDKVYGCTGYDIYKNGHLIKSVGDVSFWTDDGSVATSATSPPSANTTVVTIPLTSVVEFVNYNDRVFFTTGNGLCVYDGTTASLVTPYVPTTTEETNVGINALRDITNSIHKCRYIALNWDRMFVAGDPVHPQYYYFTDVGLSPTHPQMYFPGPYAADVTSSNGSPISGMANFRDGLIIFTTDSTHAVFGQQPDPNYPDPFIERLIHPEVGCLSNRSIAIVNNSLMFVSRRGVETLVNVIASQTALNVKLLTDDIQPTFNKLTHPENTVAVFHEQQYKVCFPDDGVVLRMYVDRGAWALDTNGHFGQYVRWDADLYASSSTDGKVYKFGYKIATVGGTPTEVTSYDDDGAFVSFYFRTKSFEMGQMLNLKKTQNLFTMAKQQLAPSTVHLDVWMDYVHKEHDFDFNESTVLGAWELGDDHLGFADMIFKPFKFKAKGRLLYFQFLNEVVGEPVTIYGIGIQFKIKRL